MKRLYIILISIFSVISIDSLGQQPLPHIIKPLNIAKVKIQDPFWSPRLKLWDTKTVYDVFDKLEGKYEPDRQDLINEKEKWGRTRNALLNFDRVARGDKNTQQHDGPPWYDGLLYETIRGASDLLVSHPDKILESKIDAYIDRIAAAQAIDKDGYIDTYTTLMYADRRFGTNGGDDKWQHDIYNGGMLAEAAVHYYYATGKTKLLAVAVKMSNYMASQMGNPPKKNIIPGHAGPEEALLKMYWLFNQNPSLKNQMPAPVQEQQYYELAKFWIDARGNYGNSATGNQRRNDSSYNQDHLPVIEQTTIEGHAVRATLLATGVTALALDNKDPQYINAANNYWNNMAGKKMFITGGEGAIANGERFGADYYLPESAYLETCAAIGSAFFSERMNELQADGKYMDLFERVLYNNLLSGVSLSGDHYFYENPLIAADHNRWSWHDCPCCPPMILKMVGALPAYIYATDDEGVYVNLFIGSTMKTDLKSVKNIKIKQETNYPWKGSSTITINAPAKSKFAIHVRIPGWAQGEENPFNLYTSNLNTIAKVKVNGRDLPLVIIANGYLTINREWKKGDKIELTIPVEPRLVSPNDSINTIKGKMAIAAGPIIYGFEGVDNPDL
ncbi:MAG: six-hairpin glycosidase, partial [Bacteroidetes bacterium]